MRLSGLFRSTRPKSSSFDAAPNLADRAAPMRKLHGISSSTIEKARAPPFFSSMAPISLNFSANPRHPFDLSLPDAPEIDSPRLAEILRARKEDPGLQSDDSKHDS